MLGNYSTEVIPDASRSHQAQRNQCVPELGSDTRHHCVPAERPTRSLEGLLIRSALRSTPVHCLVSSAEVDRGSAYLYIVCDIMLVAF
jgi:hypothetical protein